MTALGPWLSQKWARAATVALCVIAVAIHGREQVVGRTRSRGPTAQSVQLSSQLRLTAEAAAARSSLRSVSCGGGKEMRRAAQNHMICVVMRGPHMFVPPLSLVPSYPLRPPLPGPCPPAQRKVLRTNPHGRTERKGGRQSELGRMIWAEVVTWSDVRPPL